MYDHVCEWCGKEYRNRVKTAKFCSRKCSGDYSHPGDVDRLCVVCDTPFTISKQFDRDTCSRPCGKWAREHPGEKPRKECLRCGETLNGKQLRISYCSPTCWMAVSYFRKGKTKRIYRRANGCLICGEGFQLACPLAGPASASACASIGDVGAAVRARARRVGHVDLLSSGRPCPGRLPPSRGLLLVHYLKWVRQFPPSRGTPTVFAA